MGFCETYTAIVEMEPDAAGTDTGMVRDGRVGSCGFNFVVIIGRSMGRDIDEG